MLFRLLILVPALVAAGAACSQPVPAEAASAAAPATSRPSRYSAPMTVPPIAVRPQTVLPPSAPLPTAPAPPVAIQRPPVVGNCDAAGCWDTNGNRLNRVGPNLMGPRGQCTTLNGIVNCP